MTGLGAVIGGLLAVLVQLLLGGMSQGARPGLAFARPLACGRLHLARRLLERPVL